MQADKNREALRLLGFAQFNLTKGKIAATQTLIDKAIVALGGKPFLKIGDKNES
jgi:hypothetical protein